MNNIIKRFTMTRRGGSVSVSFFTITSLLTAITQPEVSPLLIFWILCGAGGAFRILYNLGRLEQEGLEQNDPAAKLAHDMAIGIVCYMAAGTFLIVGPLG